MTADEEITFRMVERVMTQWAASKALQVVRLNPGDPENAAMALERMAENSPELSRAIFIVGRRHLIDAALDVLASGGAS